MSWVQYNEKCRAQVVKKTKKLTREGHTRIRTGVVRIRTESDYHYTMQPAVMGMKFCVIIYHYIVVLILIFLK